MNINGVWPSGKATGFGPAIRRFRILPSQSMSIRYRTIYSTKIYRKPYHIRLKLALLNYPCHNSIDYYGPTKPMDYTWFHKSINYIPDPFVARNVRGKLQLKRCGRKQPATWRTWSTVDSYTLPTYISNRRLEGHDPLWILIPHIFHYIGMKLDSTSFVLLHWSSSRKSWFLYQGQRSRVSSVNQ